MEEKRLEWNVEWKEKRMEKHLQGETVLTVRLCQPKVAGVGRGSARLERYLRRLTEAWQERWEKKVYLLACLDLAQRREAGEPFRPWEAALTGEVTYQDEEMISLRLDAVETRGDGRENRVRMGEVWQKPGGVPLPPHPRFFPGRRWRRTLFDRWREQGKQRREAGDCFLDAGFEGQLSRYFSPWNYCRTQQGLEFYLPQGTVAPALEGVVTFRAEAEKS